MRSLSRCLDLVISLKQSSSIDRPRRWAIFRRVTTFFGAIPFSHPWTVEEGSPSISESSSRLKFFESINFCKFFEIVSKSEVIRTPLGIVILEGACDIFRQNKFFDSKKLNSPFKTGVNMGRVEISKLLRKINTSYKMVVFNQLKLMNNRCIHIKSHFLLNFNTLESQA